MTSCSIEPCEKVRLHRERLARLREKYRFDDEAADKAVSFIENNIRHWKSPFTGQPFKLEPWQKDDIVRPLWGFRRADGTRLFRRAYIQIPRKNGKSALAAALLLLAFCTDGEGLEVYTAATKRDQAMIVFNDCKKFIERSPKLKKRLKQYVGRIVYPARGNTLMPLSSDYNNLDGLNTAAAVIDELHAHKTRHLYDVIKTSMGSREQPLLLVITTAGEDAEGVCYDEYEYSAEVLAGAIEDDEFFPLIYEADSKLEWDDPRALRQANPNYGVSAKEDFLLAALNEAKGKPSFRTAYERYHLNRWVKTTTGDNWFSVQSWRDCRREFTEKDLVGRRCYGGLDLASTTDLAALALVFPWDDGSIKVWVRHWLPEDTLWDRVDQDRVPYDVWQQGGWVKATPGNVIDQTAIVEEILELKKRFEIRTISYDDWNAVYVYTELQKKRVKMVEFVQGLKSFHPPSQEFERRVLEGTLHHCGDPCLAWQAGHVKVRRDESEKMRPVKENKSSRKRIDGIVASVMALDGMMRGERKKSMGLSALPSDLRAKMGA